MAIGRIPEPGTGIPESIVDAKGDIVTATAADTPARLAVGTTEHRLVAASGEATGLKYVADTTNYAIAAKGDLLVGTAADTLAALTVGTNGHTLVADSAEATGLKWQAASSGALVKISRTTYSNVASQAFDNVFNSTYSTYLINIEKTSGSSNSNLLFQWRKNSTTVSSGYYGNTFGYNYGGSVRNTASSATSALTIMLSQGDITDRWSTAQIYANYVGYTKTTGERSLINGTGLVSSETWTTVIGGGLYDAGGDNCNGFILSASSGNIYGTVTIYGVAI
jgi:hypothetical protein